MTPYYFGSNIRKLRKSHGWSQRELAQRLGKQTSAISSYETDGKAPTFETAIELAELFHVSIDELVYGDDADVLSLKYLSSDEKKLLLDLCSIFSSEKIPNANTQSLKVEVLVKIIKLLNL